MMHSCRRVEKQLADLLFAEMKLEDKRRLMAEIEACASCMGQYQSLTDTLFVVERTAEAGLPPESYWPRYNATLRQRLHASAHEKVEATRTREPFWKRLLAAKLPVPVPLAAALVIGLLFSSALALRRAPLAQPTVAPSSPPVESVKIITVPVVQEKIVTRYLYVERKRAAERGSRSLLATAARANEVNESRVAGSPSEEETGFFTSANLKGFQPADEMKIRVIKRNNDEK